MIVKRLTGLLACLLLFLATARAQYYNYENITAEQGLSQNDVNSILQDSYGFIWFATNDGLNRFDGKSFKKYYKNSEELSSGITSKIIEDHNLNLWVASLDRGISRLSLTTGKVEEHYTVNHKENKLPDNKIHDIICDNENNIWFLTKHSVGKIENYSGEKKEIVNVLDYPENTLANSRFRLDKSGRVWLMCYGKIGYFKNNKFIEMASEKYGSFFAYHELEHFSILATTNRIWKVPKNTYSPTNVKSFYQETKKLISTTVVDKDKCLWVGTRNGLFKYNFNKKKQSYLKDYWFEKEKVKLGLENTEIRSLYIDQTGILYVGTYGKGVFKLNGKGQKFRCYLSPNQTTNAKIRSVFKDSAGKIYFGDHSGKIYILENHKMLRKKTSRFDTINIKTSAITIGEVKSPGDKRSVIVGGPYSQSLCIIEGDQIELPKIPSTLYAIEQDKNGFVWLCSYGKGLFRWDPYGRLPLKNFRFSNGTNSIVSDIVRSLCFDVEGRLWIGTDNGISILLPSEQAKLDPTFITVKSDPENPQSLSHDYILPIVKTKDNTLWVGTMGEGLNRLIDFNKGNPIFERYTTKDGLSNNVIRSIEEGFNNDLWIASNNGISKLNRKTGRVENYTPEHGLQDYEFSDLASCKLDNGMLVFGGTKGINIFSPNEIVNDWSTATPAFTAFFVSHKKINAGDTISSHNIFKNDINETESVTLPFAKNSFAIELASLHYSNPKGNKCRYKLEGFDNDWIETSTGNVAKYTNLSSGDYTFKLKVSNDDGVWNNKEKTLKIEITPPFFLSNYMIAFYIALFIVLMIFFRRYSIIDIKRKHELNLAALEKSKEEELHQMKIQFFMNISHEFKTPLSLIINPLEQLLSDKELPSRAKIKNYHKLMLHNARFLLRLVNQLMDFRKMDLGLIELDLEKQNIKSFLRKEFQAFKPLSKRKSIRFSYNAPEEFNSLFIDTDKLQKVVYNLLSNAFKHTPESGKIDLTLVDESGKYFKIIVSDSGKGISDSIKKDIFKRHVQERDIDAVPGSGIGLAYTKSLIELMHGSIEFDSRIGKGTTFFVRLPKVKKAPAQKQLIEQKSIVEDKIELYDTEVLEEVAVNETNSSTEQETPSEKQHTILIVEDNIELCVILKNLLESDYLVEVANNGEEGIETARRVMPDLILTDVSMPIIDGIEMTSRLRFSHETSHIPIVMLTAYGSDMNHQKGLEKGADVYLSKPINSNILLAQIKSILQNRQKFHERIKKTIELKPSELTPVNKEEAFIKELMEHVESHLDDPNFSVIQLAKLCGFSQFILNKKLKAVTGLKASQFIRSIRIKRACQLLEQRDLTVAEVTYDVGFSDLRYFRECFHAETGYLPSEYKKRKELQEFDQTE